MIGLPTLLKATESPRVFARDRRQEQSPFEGTPDQAQMTSPDIVVAVRNLVRSFDEGSLVREVLRGVDLTIARGELVVLLGRSGAGKSTFLNLISGLDVPDAGSVKVGDAEFSKMSDRQRTLYRRRHIGFVFQSYNLIPTLSVLENVLLPLELCDHPVTDRRVRALDYLDRVGLADRGDSFPDRLSGGEQQRVAIARALVHDPVLVLADEPSGNLDFRTGRMVMDLFTDLVRKQGNTMLVVTHDADFLERADRLLAMRDGQIREVSGHDEAVGV